VSAVATPIKAAGSLAAVGFDLATAAPEADTSTFHPVGERRERSAEALDVELLRETGTGEAGLGGVEDRRDLGAVAGRAAGRRGAGEREPFHRGPSGGRRV